MPLSVKNHDYRASPQLPRIKMKSSFISASLVVLLSLGLMTGTSSAQTLYYNRLANPGWYSGTSWSSAGDTGPFTQDWTPDGSAAVFGDGVAATISLSSDVTVSGLSNTDADSISLTGSGQTLTFSSVNPTISGKFSIDMTIAGNVNQTAGAVSWGGVVSAYSGTYTVSGGTTDIGQSNHVSSASNFVIVGGSLRLGLNSVTPSMGSLTVNSGNVQIGRKTGNFGFNVSVSSLSGTSGGTPETTGTIGNLSNSQDGAVNTLTVDQASNTEFQGNINGNFAGGNSRLTFVKSGTGALTLSGTISNMERTTVLNAGTLLLNDSSKSKTFGDTVGTTALQVNGGILGGTGTIATTVGDNIIIANGGKLAAGLLSTAGQSTYALGFNAALDISTISTGALMFDLGDDSEAGVSHDMISITSGTLTIGSGVLNFDNFAFNHLVGFGAGEYTLFNTVGITGTLGTALTGNINGLGASLSQSGNDILLTVVVPEPSTVSFFLLAGLFAAFRTRHRS